LPLATAPIVSAMGAQASRLSLRVYVLP